MGAATTLLEARFLGRSCIGIDVDPIACLIARVVTTRYSSRELDDLEQTVTSELVTIEKELSHARVDEITSRPGAMFSIGSISGVIPSNAQIAYWFAPIHRAVLASLISLSTSYQVLRHRDLIHLAISSSIVHKWPNTLSHARDIDHSRPHRVLRKDLPLTSQVEIFRRSFKSIIHVVRMLDELSATNKASARVIEGDVAICIPKLGTQVDYILTSPPYFNAIDYPRAHQFSHWWLWPDRDRLSRSQYIGLKGVERGVDFVDRCAVLIPQYMPQIAPLKSVSGGRHAAFCRYVVEMNQVVERMIRVLKPGKSATFVLANNTIKGVQIPVANIVATLFERSGLTSVATEERKINSDRRRYPYGITGFRGLMECEFLLEGKKPRK